MFGMSLFGGNIYGQQEEIEVVNEPEHKKQWNKQCVNTSTWTEQRVFQSERRNTCNNTLDGVSV